MEKIMELIKIQEELKKIDNATLSKFLSNTLERQAEKNIHVIGFVGDDLVGKSTIINSLLGENVLPTTIIPSLAEITIKYGDEQVAYDHNGSIIKDNDLSESVEEKEFVSISVNNEFLKNNSLMIKEFHGLLSKANLSDMDMMADVYKCDAVVMVMAAEHLLSESEKIFINNYIKYVGANHLLLIVNKLTSVLEEDVVHVLDYVKNQIALKFSDVKWTIFDLSSRYDELIKNYAPVNFKTGFMTMFGINQDADNTPILNTLQYIKEQLEIQRTELEKLEGKSKEERIKEKEKREQQKELEKVSIEGALIEFQQKRNSTIELIDKYIKNQFTNVLAEIEKSFLESSNKYSWYEKELDVLWRNLVGSVSEKVDNFVTSKIEKDIQWLNSLLKTKLEIQCFPVDIPEDSIKSSDNMLPYEGYKRYIPIGIGGGVVIGYCLFHIAGVAISLGGGVLAYSYLEMKSLMQIEELQKEFNSKIKNISLDIRKISKKEIEKIYAEVLSEFNSEAMDIIDAKYGVDDTEKYECDKYIEKRKYIDNLIKQIEEI